MADKIGIRIVLKSLLNQVESWNEVLEQQRLYHEAVLMEPENNLLTGFPSSVSNFQPRKSDKYREVSNAKLLSLANSFIAQSTQHMKEFMK
jgi:hypothetical protein